MARYGILDKKDGMRYAVNEGFFRHAIDPAVPPKSMAGLEPYNLWYDVPFEVMLPKREQCTNLMIPVALSASSVAFSSMRIETMYMDLGTAAGVASRQFFIEPQQHICRPRCTHWNCPTHCWKWNTDSARRVHFGDDAMTNGSLQKRILGGLRTRKATLQVVILLLYLYWCAFVI